MTGVLGAMGPACTFVGVCICLCEKCVNVCDLPTLPQALSLMCMRTVPQGCIWMPIYAQAGLYMCSRGPCNAGKVPLQHSVVLHNVSTAAGDDASHNHAQDETPTLR